MQIVAVETLLPPKHPAIAWVRIHTDEEVVGLGETLGEPHAVAEIVHRLLAPLLIGQDPLRIEHHWNRLFRAIDYRAAGGAELRALSAIDLALWDTFGKVTDRPVYELLGGACRERVPVYNTCGSYGDMNDRDRFLSDPAGLARELREEGIRAMKLWPFDDAAVERDGHAISAADLASGVERVAAIRDALGDEMEIMMEGHALWSLPAAIRIARALEPLRPAWLEDMVPSHDAGALARLRAATTIPVIASERLTTRWATAAMLARGGADIVMFDPIWCGGLSEARKIATVASLHQLPIAPHNCGGPITHLATTHLCAHLGNVLTMETIRAFYRGFFGDLVTQVPIPIDGHLPLPFGPGFGAELTPATLARADLMRATTTAATAAVQGYAAGDPWATQRF